MHTVDSGGGAPLESATDGKHRLTASVTKSMYASALLAWSVRYKLNHASSFQLRRFIRSLTLSIQTPVLTKSEFGTQKLRFKY